MSETVIDIKPKGVEPLTRGQKAWATRKANEAKKKTEAPVEFKKVTGAEQEEAPGRKLLDVEDIIKLNLQDLINYAEGLKVETYSKTRADILVELGVTQRKGGKIFVRPQPSAERLRYLIERNYIIPMNTIFPEDSFDDWLKIVAEEPMAFNGADLSDKTGEIVHTLKAQNVCVCGAKVDIPTHPETGDPFPVMMCEGMPGTIRRNGKIMEVRKCIGTDRFRKFMFHKIPQWEG